MCADATSRTLVLSVVAVDLVAYSQKSVAEQMSLKEHFNQVLLQAIRDISIADRIILDTGDGVAMGFLGDPEDALYVAMFMHDAINRDSAGSPSGGVDGNAIRIGINLGPVKLATGVGGHPNIIGDGINVAERIMSFAEPGQFTASRPFFEVMSRMSDHYSTLFRYAGVRTDKQVRAHDVYLVGKSAAAFHHAERGVTERAAQRAGQPVIPPAIASVIARTPAMPAKTMAKSSPPSAAAAGKPAAESAPAASKTAAPVRAQAKAAEIPAAAALIPGQRFGALIDFLEDRNKVATTATLLAVVAVTVGALLVYRKMLIIAPAGSAPAVAVLSAAPAGKDRGAAAMAPPLVPAVAPAPATGKSAAPPAAVKADSAAIATLQPTLPASNRVDNVAPKVESKAPPPTVNIITPPPPVTPAASKPAAAPVAPAARAEPAKGSERQPLPASEAAPVAARDKPKDTKIERAERSERPDKATARDETRGEPRKQTPPRTAIERDKSPPAVAAPIVPTYQTPAEAPKPESVSPTPRLQVPSVANAEIVAISRSAPPFPVEGIRQGIKMGFVKARLTIDAGGSVIDVVILEARPIAAFGRETRTTLKQWKFNPGAPGRSYEIEITFKP